MPHATCRMPHAACLCVLAFCSLWLLAAIFCCLYCRHNQEMPEKWQQFICSSANLVKIQAAGGKLQLPGGGGRDGHKPVAVCVGKGEGEAKLEPEETQVREGVEAVVAQGEGDVAEALAEAEAGDVTELNPIPPPPRGFARTLTVTVRASDLFCFVWQQIRR